MQKAIGLVLAAAVGALLFLRLRQPGEVAAEPLPQVTLRDVPQVLSSLTAAGRDGSFAVFLFGRAGESPAERDALNVQFSIEGGKPGLDWVLLAPPNIADEARVAAFLAKERRSVVRREMNRVRYLRVEGDDLALVCQRLLKQLYEVGDTQDLSLIVEGFPWPA